jgi:hypothetical protein
MVYGACNESGQGWCELDNLNFGTGISLARTSDEAGGEGKVEKRKWKIAAVTVTNVGSYNRREIPRFARDDIFRTL